MKKMYHEFLGIFGSTTFLKLPAYWSPSHHHPSGKGAIHRCLHLPQCLWNHSARWASPDETILLSFPVVKLFPPSQFSFSIWKKISSTMSSPSENLSFTTQSFSGALYRPPWATHSSSLTSKCRFSPKLLSHLPKLPHLSTGSGEAS